MTQIKYDITEFIIQNREEIKTYLIEKTSNVEVSKGLFENCPEIYQDLLLSSQKHYLIQYIAEYFPSELENIFLICHDRFVKILLN